MFIVALALVAVGLLVSVLGFKLFNIILPIVGLVAGTMIGFTGFQGVFGHGTISTTVAVFVAIVVGLVMALLSYAFFDIALVVLCALIGASVFGYLGVALGLNSNGFIVFLLSLSGFVVGLIAATSSTMTANFVITFSAFIGVAFILAGVFLMAGHLSVEQLNNDGVINSIIHVVNQSFLWLFVWLGGSMLARGVQIKALEYDMMTSDYEYVPKKK